MKRYSEILKTMQSNKFIGSQRIRTQLSDFPIHFVHYLANGNWCSYCRKHFVGSSEEIKKKNYHVIQQFHFEYLPQRNENKKIHAPPYIHLALFTLAETF